MELVFALSRCAWMTAWSWSTGIWKGCLRLTRSKVGCLHQPCQTTVYGGFPTPVFLTKTASEETQRKCETVASEYSSEGWKWPGCCFGWLSCWCGQTTFAWGNQSGSCRFHKSCFWKSRSRGCCDIDGKSPLGVGSHVFETSLPGYYWFTPFLWLVWWLS